MKKKYLLSTVFASLLMMCQAYGQITITGSGCTTPICFFTQTGTLNSTYTFTTQNNGRNFYESASASLLLIGFQNGQWEIYDGCGGLLYSNPSTSAPNPPATGWSTGMGGCAGSPAPTLAGDVVLPVELISFNIKNENKEVHLSWQTATEINNEYFQIERSADGERFESIGEVSGVGNSNEIQEYQFMDERPLEGMNYYRLRQVDFDGQEDIHKVVSIKIDGQFGVNIYPNPGKEGVTLYLEEELTQDGTVSIYDLTGRILSQQSIQAETINTLLNINDLPYSGTYLVTLQAGNKVENIRFIKQ